MHHCIACESTFTSEKKLDKHYHADHKGIKPYRCTMCDEKFAFSSNLRKHIKSVHEGKYKCDRCDSTFAESRSLKVHSDRVHDKIRNFKCSHSECDLGFYKKSDLKRHVARVHDGIKVELVSKELNHFEVIAGLFRQIGGHSSRFVLFCSF